MKIEETLFFYIGENYLKLLKTEYPDKKWNFSTKKLAYRYETFSTVVDYQKLVDNLKKEDFFSKLKHNYPYDIEIERRKEIIDLFKIKNGEKPKQLYLKSDVLLLACVSEKFLKVSIKEFVINPQHCVSLPGYTWQYGLKCTGIKLQML